MNTPDENVTDQSKSEGVAPENTADVARRRRRVSILSRVRQLEEEVVQLQFACACYAAADGRREVSAQEVAS